VHEPTDQRAWLRSEPKSDWRALAALAAYLTTLAVLGLAFLMTRHL
jgi:hypothetical protein